MEEKLFKEIALVTGGSSPVVDVTDYSQVYLITGSGTTTADNTISLSAASTEGQFFFFIYNGNFNIVTNSNAITILGTPLTAAQATKRGMYIFFAFGGAIIPVFSFDLSQNGVIDLAKLVSLGLNKVVVTDPATGVLIPLAQLTAALGGTGQNFSGGGVTGFMKWLAGVASVSAITDSKIIYESFETGAIGDYHITFDFPCTVTNIRARVSKLIEATNNATLELQDDSGGVMTGNNLTGGQLTITGASTTGTMFESTLLTNNTFIAGEKMLIRGAKTTPGGSVNVEVTYTRNS